MNKFFRRQWVDFVDELSKQPLGAAEFAMHLVQFIGTIEKSLGEEFFRYGLDAFVGLDHKDYPIDFSLSSPIEIEHLIKGFQRTKNSSAKLIAQTLRDALEQIFVIETDFTCPNCVIFGLKAFKEHRDQRLVFLCTNCGRAFYPGNLEVPSVQLDIATTDDLRKFSLIGSNAQNK